MKILCGIFYFLIFINYVKVHRSPEELGDLTQISSKSKWNLITTGWLMSSLMLSQFYGLKSIHIFHFNSYVNLGINVSSISSVLVTLICFLSLIIYNYSYHYMQGEQNNIKYYKYISVCFLSIILSVSTTNLMVLALSWALCSLYLCRILNLYSNRTELRRALGKASLFFRGAEAFMFLAVFIVGQQLGTFEIPLVIKKINAQSYSPTLAMQLASLFVVFAVILKTAQFPFNGWVTKVMEAPTPISALLHAGIINLGGYVLILLSPLITGKANTLLLVISLFTTVLSAMAMRYQTRVKCKLAWSTCSQMGFMLLECALGVYQLAFIHLICHSLYKAHGFLYSGNIVEETSLYLKDLNKPNLALGFIMAVIVVNAIEHFIFGTHVKTHLSYVPHWILTFSMATVFGYVISSNSYLNIIKYICLSCLFVSAFLMIDKSLVSHLEVAVTHDLNLKSMSLLCLFFLLFVINNEKVNLHFFNAYKTKKAIAQGLYIDDYMSYLILKMAGLFRKSA